MKYESYREFLDSAKPGILNADIPRTHARVRKLGGFMGESLPQKVDRAIENFEDILIYLKRLKDELS
jgi:hypothetical protein